MKRKVLFMALCMSVMLSACGSDNQETEAPEDTTISVDESELVPVTPVVVEQTQPQEVSENSAETFKSEFTSLSDLPVDETEAFRMYCTVMKNDFYAITLQSTRNEDSFLDIVIPDKDLAMGIFSLDGDIGIFPQYKDASSEDAKFYNDYTWQEFIEIRPGSGVFSEDTVEEDDQEDEEPQIIAEEPQEQSQDEDQPDDLAETEDTQEDQAEQDEDEDKEEPQEQPVAVSEPENDDIQKNNYPVYELTGFSLKFGNQKSSLITNAEQLQQVLSEMGY